jgi:hypothetical protein
MRSDPIARDACPDARQPGRLGNKLVTALAISALCGYNGYWSRWSRNPLEIRAFKHHRNVLPIPRHWQKFRTQNPVHVMGV